MEFRGPTALNDTPEGVRQPSEVDLFTASGGSLTAAKADERRESVAARLESCPDTEYLFTRIRVANYRVEYQFSWKWSASAVQEK